jgi:ElaB/YqjD/DUF883 family membrane-anchored ribosome-binding protein
MTGNIQDELTQVIGLTRSLYGAASEAVNRSEAQMNRISTLVDKLEGIEGRVAISVKNEVKTQFSDAAMEAAKTIVERQKNVNNRANEAINAYDKAVRHSAMRIFLTCFGASTVGIVAVLAFAYLTVNQWAGWLGYPAAVVPVVTCQDANGKPLQCVRVSVASGQPVCRIASDGNALCFPARN